MAALFGIDEFVFVANVLRSLIFVFIPGFIFLVAQFVTVIAMNVVPMWTIMSVVGKLLEKSIHHFPCGILRCWKRQLHQQNQNFLIAAHTIAFDEIHSSIVCHRRSIVAHSG